MTVTFTLPAAVERELRVQFSDLGAAAKGAALVELYRLNSLSHGQLAESLGISRDETNAVLKRHKVVEDFPTIEEFDAQMARAWALKRDAARRGEV